METPIYYASPIPWYRGRRIQIVTIRLLLVAAITCSVAWAFQIAVQLMFLTQQHQWMRYTMPADKVVLAVGDSAVAPLVKMPGYHTIAAIPGGASAPAVAADPPKDIPSPYWISQCSLVFLHQLQVPGHHQRLVSVVLDPRAFDQAGCVTQLLAAAQIPANLRPGVRPIFCAPCGNSGELTLGATKSIRLFAGQPDPVDESHFTIRCEVDGTPRTIDGWMMPNDSVQLQQRY